MKTMWLVEKNNGNIVDNTFHSLFGYTPLHDFKQRFATLKYIRDHELLTPDIKNKIFDVFVIYQKDLAVLNNVVRRFKYARMKHSGPNFDLVGNNLNELPDHLKITIAHLGLKYTFRVSDLINIINKSLTYREELFLLIQSIKNPYTNIEFTNANLFQIYTHIKRNTNITMPVLFHLYFTTWFDKNKFANKYEAIALDHSIQNYIDEYEESELVELSHTWIKTFKHSYRKFYKNLHIDKHYSRPKLVKELRPILKEYLISSHTLTSSVKYSAFTNACNLMIKLLNDNKNFGINTRHNDKRQILFKNLSHINKFSFNPNNEIYISVVDKFLNKQEEFCEFKYPNIIPFNDNIFIIRNYVNVTTSNNIQNIRNQNRTRRRLSYPEFDLTDSPDNVITVDAANINYNMTTTLGRATGIRRDHNVQYDDDDEYYHDDDDENISIDSF